VKALCERYGVTRAGYYAWCGRAASTRDQDDAHLSVLIRAIFDASEGTYGSPRIHAAMAQAGIHVARKRVARLMCAAELKARAARIYRRSPGTGAFFMAIPNRIIKRVTTAPDQIWVGDVTYLKVCGQWRYLAAVMDRHSRRVLGWAMSRQRDLRLTLGALNRTLLRRRPAPGLAFHSDRGVEYSAYAYRARLAAVGIVQSMNRPRELTDNAFMESFWHSMKSEVIHTLTFDNDTDLIKVVRRYIRRYNSHRLHSALGYRSPIDYEHAVA
jgi:putative transposase